MIIRSIRVYADTSVFGGILDEEFAEISKTFFEQVRKGRFHLYNAVNTLHGYSTIAIHSPMEVVSYEEKI
ncbi:MAG: hypothetical protein ACLFVT_03085 [Syntrophobacteria bacterium]